MLTFGWRAHANGASLKGAPHLQDNHLGNLSHHVHNYIRSLLENCSRSEGSPFPLPFTSWAIMLMIFVTSHYSPCLATNFQGWHAGITLTFINWCEFSIAAQLTKLLIVGLNKPSNNTKLKALKQTKNQLRFVAGDSAACSEHLEQLVCN